MAWTVLDRFIWISLKESGNNFGEYCLDTWWCQKLVIMAQSISVLVILMWLLLVIWFMIVHRHILIIVCCSWALLISLNEILRLQSLPSAGANWDRKFTGFTLFLYWAVVCWIVCTGSYVAFLLTLCNLDQYALVRSPTILTRIINYARGEQ